MKNKINILGQDYQIVVDNTGNNPNLEDANGYMEPYSKKIVVDGNICNKSNTKQAENLEMYVRHVYRHEIMHAFFEESGLAYKFTKDDEDFLVDWIAKQFPKMKKIFEELGVAD